MPLRRPAPLFLAALAAAILAAPSPAQTTESADPNDAYARNRIPASFAQGSPTSRVYVHVWNPPADAQETERTKERLAREFGLRPGGSFEQFHADAALAHVKRLPWVKEAEVRLYAIGAGGEVTVVLLVTLLGAEPKPVPPPAGAIGTSQLGQLPLLWKDDQGMVKLIVNPSAGAYVDRDAFLGNPGAFGSDPAMAGTLTHLEYGMELGIGGIFQLGDSPFFLFGTGSYVWSGTLGADIYSTTSSRGIGAWEDGYGGLLIAPHTSSSSFRLTVGRQKFSLNRNFQIGHVLGAANGGDRAATDLSPRNAYDLVVDALYQVGRLSFQAFFARANELPSSDSRTEYAGVNVAYTDSRTLDASLSLIGIPHSKGAYPLPDGSRLAREGLRSVNPRLKWSRAFGVPGLWLEGEWAHQWNTNYSMSADGWGLWAGYTFEKTPWKPALLYRYAVVTGDDPSTSTYERFDNLTGGVQRDWAQGMTMIKLSTNRNLRTHRFEASLRPKGGLDLSVDCYDFWADTLNNLGGQPALATYASSHLGQEITPTLQWMVNANLFVQGLASYLVPGPGLRDTLPGPTHVWQTYKLSLYWFY